MLFLISFFIQGKLVRDLSTLCGTVLETVTVIAFLKSDQFSSSKDYFLRKMFKNQVSRF